MSGDKLYNVYTLNLRCEIAFCASFSGFTSRVSQRTAALAFPCENPPDLEKEGRMLARFFVVVVAAILVLSPAALALAQASH